MKQSVRPTEQDVEYTVRTYSDMLFKLCVVMLGNITDAEDAVSEVFLKYIKKQINFQDEEHEKAWLIRVATNVCRDIQRFRMRHNFINLDDLQTYCANEEEIGILEDIVNLNPKYKEVMLLHYIQGYKTSEIAEILNISSSCVRKRLEYGRKQLKFEYERGYENESTQISKCY